jgi:hypothetical protein
MERNRFPLSRWIKMFRAIVAKLGVGSTPAVPHYPPPKPPGDRRVVGRSRRRGKGRGTTYTRAEGDAVPLAAAAAPSGRQGVVARLAAGNIATMLSRAKQVMIAAPCVKPLK